MDDAVLIRRIHRVVVAFLGGGGGGRCRRVCGRRRQSSLCRLNCGVFTRTVYSTARHLLLID